MKICVKSTGQKSTKKSTVLSNFITGKFSYMHRNCQRYLFFSSKIQTKIKLLSVPASSKRNIIFFIFYIWVQEKGKKKEESSFFTTITHFSIFLDIYLVFSMFLQHNSLLWFPFLLEKMVEGFFGCIFTPWSRHWSVTIFMSGHIVSLSYETQGVFLDFY